MQESSSFFNSMFNDFDQYAHFVKQADIEHVQLGKGVFNGTLLQLVHGPLILSVHTMNQTILQHGKGIDHHTTFLIPGNMEQDFVWRKQRLRGNVIGILQSGMEHNAITRPNFLGMPVSIENTFLEQLACDLGYPDFMTTIIQKESIVIRSDAAARLHYLIKKNCSKNGSLDEEVLFEIPKTIIETLSEALGTGEIRRGNSRREIFRKGQEFIHENIENTISIRNICHDIGVSERNLRYAFREQIGLSPKQYLQRYKLNQVRRLLKSENIQNIGDITRRFGFWHSGQFAADYKNLFGELPSETKN